MDEPCEVGVIGINNADHRAGGHVLILGAAGMIGGKLTARLVADENVGGRTIERLTLADVVAPQQPVGVGQVELVATDLAAPGEAERLVEGRPDLIFHLAAVVQVKLRRTSRRLPGQSGRHPGTPRGRTGGAHRRRLPPRLVFTSSIAVYGAPLPNPIPEDFQLTPLTSCGTQKAIGGALVGRLHPARFRRRHRNSATHHLHPAGDPEQSGFRASFPASFASRWSDRRRSCRFRRRFGIGRLTPARPWSSWFGRRH